MEYNYDPATIAFKRNGRTASTKVCPVASDARLINRPAREAHQLVPLCTSPLQLPGGASVGRSSLATSSFGARSTASLGEGFYHPHPLKALEHHMQPSQPRRRPSAPSNTQPPACPRPSGSSAALPRQQAPAPFEVAGQSYGPLWTEALRRLDPELAHAAAVDADARSQANDQKLTGGTLLVYETKYSGRRVVSAGGRVLYPVADLFGAPAPRPHPPLGYFTRLHERRTPPAVKQRTPLRQRSPLRGLMQAAPRPAPSERALEVTSVLDWAESKAPVWPQEAPAPFPGLPKLAAVAEAQWVSVPQSRQLLRAPSQQSAFASSPPSPRTPLLHSFDGCAF
jgi:hypothetical protein